ncbi:MAG: nuclear transport factor 2 family protein [Patescibacteria group bacterium]
MNSKIELAMNHEREIEISKEDREKLRQLEDSMWIAETRFDRAYMESVLAPDFFEFGRSGRIYQREDTLGARGDEIKARLPFKNFELRPVVQDVIQVTYTSEVEYNGEVEVGNRSSIWVKTPKGWKLKFHQGTPVNK